MTCRLGTPTMVQILGNNNNKHVPELLPGDVIYSYDGFEECVELGTIKYLSNRLDHIELIKITMCNDQSIVCSPELKFGVIKDDHIEYIRARDLDYGMRVKTNYKDHSAERIDLPVKKVGDVAVGSGYDVSMMDLQNIFLGESIGFLVSP